MLLTDAQITKNDQHNPSTIRLYIYLFFCHIQTHLQYVEPTLQHTNCPVLLSLQYADWWVSFQHKWLTMYKMFSPSISISPPFCSFGYFFSQNAEGEKLMSDSHECCHFFHSAHRLSSALWVTPPTYRETRPDCWVKYQTDHCTHYNEPHNWSLRRWGTDLETKQNLHLQNWHFFYINNVLSKIDVFVSANIYAQTQNI